MGDWDDEPCISTASAVKQQSHQNNDDEWGSDSKNEIESNTRGGFRGRGRGRGRGSTRGVDHNREGRGDFQRSNNDDGENESSDHFGEHRRGGRGRGGFRGSRGGAGNREDRQSNENGDENKDANNEGEQPKREIYIPPEPTEDETEIFSNAISAGINFDKFDNIEVKLTGNNIGGFTEMKKFEESGLREHLLTNIKRSGYTKPTPIQKNAIPIILAKRDIMGCAQTGSGKTAAFVLPILHTIMQDNESVSPGRPQALIVAPTRELVIQIFEEARKFAMQSWVKVNLAYGGTASRHQSERISNGCHVLVATPGRLLDFVNKSIITFEDLKFLVLDEADRMLDMGFRDNIDTICNHSTLEKDKVTTLMFSATFPESIQHLAGKYLRDYIFLTVGIVGGASTDVEQEFLEVSRGEKKDKLTEILTEYATSSDEDRILVFVETKRTADYIASFMSDNVRNRTTIKATSIHGDRLQREREEALRDFRTGRFKVLIATAVAARGLDIRGVTHVINYDLPKDADEYVHRIGRTGRVGNRGKATSFFDSENSNDNSVAPELIRILNQANQPVPPFLGSNAGGHSAADTFGGEDIRANAPGQPQQQEEDW